MTPRARARQYCYRRRTKRVFHALILQSASPQSAFGTCFAGLGLRGLLLADRHYMWWCWAARGSSAFTSWSTAQHCSLVSRRELGKAALDFDESVLALWSLYSANERRETPRDVNVGISVVVWVARRFAKLLRFCGGRAMRCFRLLTMESSLLG